MTTERESRILIAAKTLARSSSSELSVEDNRLMYAHGPVVGSFICGARWSDNNPINPWVNVNERMPEMGVPVLTYMVSFIKGAKPILLINVLNEKGWKETMRKYYKVTHWMPVPPIPTNK